MKFFLYFLLLAITYAVNRPVTAQQRDDAQKFSTKFTEIAKAYAEGYKAAIKAVQARALIAQRRLYQSRVDARSVIPSVPIIDNNVNRITERSSVASSGFSAPVPNQVTENAMEKSGIPRPVYKLPSPSNEFNNADEVATLIPQANKEKEASDFTNLLKEQQTNEQKRNVKERHRRSHMPYLGQNLDALGIVRAKPNWEPAKKKTLLPNVVQQAKPQPRRIVPQQSMYPSQQPENPIYTDRYSSVRRTFPNKQVYNPFAQRLQVAQQQMRQNVPQPYNPYYNNLPAYANPYYGGFVSSPQNNNKKSNVEVAANNLLPGVDRKKKSASPEPDVAALNYAARHRNVYLDGVSGDPYSGGSSVLSRQNVYYKKH